MHFKRLLVFDGDDLKGVLSVMLLALGVDGEPANADQLGELVSVFGKGGWEWSHILDLAMMAVSRS